MLTMRLLVAAALVGGIALQGPAAFAQAAAEGPPGPVGEKGSSGKTAPAYANAGQSVDSRGFPAADPSDSVRALNEQGLKNQDVIRALVEKRQDDIRALGDKQTDTSLRAIDRISEIRYTHSLEMLKATFDRLDSESRIRAELTKENTVKETDRINAIRAVDVQAVQVANERATSAATSLAAQVIQSAEVLRTQQARQGEDLRTFVTSTNAETNKRITVIEQALSEGRGKQAFQDPAIINLTEQVRLLTQQRATTAGADTGQSNAMFYLIAAVMAFIGLGGLIVSYNNKQPAQQPPPYPYHYPPSNGYPPQNPPRNGNGSVT